MTQDIGLNIYSKNHKIISTYISWLKGVIKRNEKFRNEKFRNEKFRIEKFRIEKFRNEKFRIEKFRIEKFRNEKFRIEKFRIDVDNLSNYFEGIDGDSEVMYQSLKKILSNEGIVVSKGTDYYGTEFLTFSFGEIGDIGGIVETSNADDNGLNKWEEKSLENNKLYNEETKCLICPECHRYSVEFSSPSERWWCSHCIDNVNFHNYNLTVSDKDKYHIYKLWGAEALSVFTNEPMKKTIKFIASYFKNCCVSKKDKCLYFDFFKDKEKEGKMVEIEGDVINERSEMGIVHRNARSE